jgi:hypothetical protein
MIELQLTPEEAEAIRVILALVSEDYESGCRVLRRNHVRHAMDVADRLRQATPSEPGAEFLLSGGPLHALLVSVASDTGVSAITMQGPMQNQRVIRARRIFARRAKERGHSLTAIGAMLHRHHTTVMNLLRYPPGANTEAA